MKCGILASLVLAIGSLNIHAQTNGAAGPTGPRSGGGISGSSISGSGANTNGSAGPTGPRSGGGVSGSSISGGLSGSSSGHASNTGGGTQGASARGPSSSPTGGGGGGGNGTGNPNNSAGGNGTGSGGAGMSYTGGPNTAGYNSANGYNYNGGNVYSSSGNYNTNVRARRTGYTSGSVSGIGGAAGSSVRASAAAAAQAQQAKQAMQDKAIEGHWDREAQNFVASKMSTFGVMKAIDVEGHLLTGTSVSLKAFATAYDTLTTLARANQELTANMIKAGFNVDLTGASPAALGKIFGLNMPLAGAAHIRSGTITVSSQQSPRNLVNTISHEYAHQVYMKTFNKEQKDIIDAVYNHAMQKPAYAGTYASTDSDEYFAEAVSAYFANGSLGFNRSQLVKNDPIIAGIVSQVLGGHFNNK